LCHGKLAASNTPERIGSAVLNFMIVMIPQLYYNEHMNKYSLPLILSVLVLSFVFLQIPARSQNVAQSFDPLLYLDALKNSSNKNSPYELPKPATVGGFSLQSFLNDASPAATTQTPTTNSFAQSIESTFVAGGDDTQLALATLSNDSGLPGSILKVSGTGLEDVNSILFGTTEIAATKISAHQLSVIVPMLTAGVYDIEIKNKKGLSESPARFVITKPNAVLPKITSVYPSIVKLGDTVTITGENFAPTGNFIFYTFNEVENVPSVDGKTLSFTVRGPDDVEDIEAFFEVDTETVVKLPMYVANENGYSDRISPFIISVE